MARNLLQNLNAAMFSQRRMPRFKVYVYDILSGGDSLDDIVRGQELAASTGPRDFTADCVQVQIEERAGDFVETGIPTSSIVVDLVDPHNFLNPYNYLAAPTGDGRWLREGNVVRIVEGDARVDEDEWVETFTGQIVGQAGVNRGRVGNRATITFKALSREMPFLRMVNTTQTYAENVTYLSMAEDIATTDMGLHPDVVNFPNIGTELTAHTKNYFAEISPLEAIAHIFFADLYLPRFNGKGELTATSGIVTQYPVRIYDGDLAGLVRTIEYPYHDEPRVNAVEVIGLMAGLEKKHMPRQELAVQEITTGYFARNERVKTHWSKDHSLLAEDVSMRVLQSIAGGLTPLGGEESFDLIPAPNADQDGSIGCYITIGTGFAPYLMVLLLIVHVAAAAIPDEVAIFSTIPVGRIIQAIVLAGAMAIMTMIGRGSYQLIGRPFQYYFAELAAEARETGVTLKTRNAVSIKNTLITYQSLANVIAEELLYRRAAMSNPRVVTMLTDLRLEVDDVWQRAGRRYLNASISRTLKRNAPPISTLNCYEVTPGVKA